MDPVAVPKRFIGQVGQQAEPQLFPRVPVGQPVAFQQRGVFPAALRSGKQPCNDAQCPSLGRYSPLQGHAAYRPGPDQVNRQEIQQVFDHIRHRQQEQQRHRPAVEPEPQQQHQKQGGQDHSGNIPAAFTLSGRPSQGADKEEIAHMPRLALPLPAQGQHPFRRLPLRQTVLPGQQAEPVPIAGAGAVVHPAIFPRRVPAQSLFHLAVGLQNF